MVVEFYMDSWQVRTNFIAMASHVYEVAGIFYIRLLSEREIIASVKRFADGTRRVSLFDHAVSVVLPASDYINLRIYMEDFESSAFVRLSWFCDEAELGILSWDKDGRCLLNGVVIDMGITRRNLLKAELLCGT